MKVFYFILFLSCLNFSWAQLARIGSIEEGDPVFEYPDVSEDALPHDLESLLLNANSMRFTPISSLRARQLFNTLKSNRRARMSYPNGWCTRRRIYIQNWLRAKNILSGRLYINCPGNRGRLRLRDQVSGRYFTFTNFHDTNVVLVRTSRGSSYRIMDLQYQSAPIGLGSYLAQIEAYQRLEPARVYNDFAGICYWRITSPRFVEGIEGEFTPKVGMY